MSSVKDYKKLFVNELDWFSARGHTPWQVFGDFLELGAIALHQLPYNAGDFPKGETFQHYESQYLERSGRYSRDELTRISAMTWYTNLALQQEPRDFLGEIAGEQELLNQDGGQFFTPYSLCKVMAGFQFSNIESLVKEKGIVTVDDPASGGGAMLIAAAEACMEQGIDPRTHLQFHATDVSRNAFNMTYIQLAALDLQATVRHGNTLSNELWEARPTPQLRYFDQWRQQRLADIRSERAIEAMRRIITSDVVETSALEATVSEPEVTSNTDSRPTESQFDQLDLGDSLEESDLDARGGDIPVQQPDIVLEKPLQTDLFGQAVEVAETRKAKQRRKRAKGFGPTI